MLGSVTNVTSATGAAEWTYAYEPFGAARTEIQSDPTASANLLRFAGEYADPTGLYHLRARQYDTNTGRFTATDPLTPSMTRPYLSSYVYADNLPTALIDPSGWGPVWADGAGGEAEAGCSNVGGWDFANDLALCYYEVKDVVQAVWRATPRPLRRCIVGGAAVGALAGAWTKTLHGAAGGAALGCVLGTTGLYRRIG